MSARSLEVPIWKLGEFAEDSRRTLSSLAGLKSQATCGDSLRREAIWNPSQKLVKSSAVTASSRSAQAMRKRFPRLLFDGGAILAVSLAAVPLTAASLAIDSDGRGSEARASVRRPAIWRMASTSVRRTSLVSSSARSASVSSGSTSPRANAVKSSSFSFQFNSGILILTFPLIFHPFTQLTNRLTKEFSDRRPSFPHDVGDFVVTELFLEL